METSNDWVMLVDLQSCSGCHACSVSCKAEHPSPWGTRRITVQTIDQGHYPLITRRFVPTMCQHCENAPCIEICPTGAISQSRDGLVLIDDESCIGAEQCIPACPYGAIFLSPEGTAQKCDLCIDRQTQGDVPACMATCPTDAIVVGKQNDPNIHQHINSFPDRWDPADAVPRTRYRGLSSSFIGKIGRINSFMAGNGDADA